MKTAEKTIGNSLLFLMILVPAGQSVLIVLSGIDVLPSLRTESILAISTGMGTSVCVVICSVAFERSNVRLIALGMALGFIVLTLAIFFRLIYEAFYGESFLSVPSADPGFWGFFLMTAGMLTFIKRIEIDTQKMRWYLFLPLLLFGLPTALSILGRWESLWQHIMVFLFTGIITFSVAIAVELLPLRRFRLFLIGILAMSLGFLLRLPAFGYHIRTLMQATFPLLTFSSFFTAYGLVTRGAAHD